MTATKMICLEDSYMKTEHDNKTLTLYLSGRIDANNAAEIDSSISAALAEYPGDTPVFDAGELEYISSAGLRVLLKFRKQFGKNLDVINASSDVYDIFEVTGFTELLNVRKRLREISLDGCEVIGGGWFSTVYRLDPETIVKVFTNPAATLAGVESDRMISREVFLHGIPTAISYDVVKTGSNYGLIYEMIDADTMSSTLRKYPERLKELSVKAARLLKKLHTTEFESGIFPDARNMLHKRMHSAYEGGAVSAEDRDLVDGIIDRIPYRNTFIHGDFHTKNLMVSGDDLMLIDVGDAGLGNPIIDFVFTYTHFVTLPVISAKSKNGFHERVIRLDAETLAAGWDIFMPEYFGTADKETLNRYSQIMRFYSSILLFSFAGVNKKLTAEEREKTVAAEMERIREAADTLTLIEGI